LCAPPVTLLWCVVRGQICAAVGIYGSLYLSFNRLRHCSLRWKLHSCFIWPTGHRLVRWPLLHPEAVARSFAHVRVGALQPQRNVDVVLRIANNVPLFTEPEFLEACRNVLLSNTLTWLTNSNLCISKVGDHVTRVIVDGEVQGAVLHRSAAEKPLANLLWG